MDKDEVLGRYMYTYNMGFKGKYMGLLNSMKKYRNKRRDNR